ncbi:Abc transporter g family member [Thalictrum thalictroides]|uniref:Abc transporter g family member n=1 Tax=Thalictrum thalictroides TaxID=46969 RepID=A0A7J6VA58_THATH|nr:Abc transporter g family member [Thalictrum thalictroides]
MEWMSLFHKGHLHVSQHDVHIGEMTVRETLAFSARCQGAGTGYEMMAELSRREKAAHIKPNPDIDVYMKAAATEGQEASVITDYILKLTQLEQELQRARSQGVFFGGGGLIDDQGVPVGINNLGSESTIFDMEYARWLE